MKKILFLIFPCIGVLTVFQFWPVEEIDFNSQIRPILNQKCGSCHGGVKQNGGLSLRFREDALKPAESGKRAIVPGKPSKSELIRRIEHADPEFRMPQESESLKKSEVQLLRKWIKQGAKWDTHWAYQKPDATIEAPFQELGWGNNGIDYFVFQKLLKENLQPSPEAEKAVLLRRVSLDLTGLPPSMEEARLFLEDNSPDAYEKLVDRLLGSLHFGERWAALWLDLARYADSQGYQKDHLRRQIWRYRDWVIDAFNRDMPFDQFTIEQLGGDLLANPTEEQLLATAFHRNTMTNDEGGTDDEEFRVAAVIDRVNTTFDVWQGATISCVQCHSHPYDPYQHDEFYKLYAYFNTTADADRTDERPVRYLLSTAQKRKKQKLEKQLKGFRESGDTLSETYKAKLEAFVNIKPGKIPVMQELPADSSRTTYIFERGNWLMHGEKVSPATPKFLSKKTNAFPPDRLGLARWLVHPENPLTARVIVNRFWEQLFGIGIVETVEDFGTQGTPPSHPALLDWLAVRFQQNHAWSVKSLLREIVLSSTYRQSSTTSPAVRERDPYNRLLARGPRVRLSSEQIRDQALATSGLLSRKMHGPSVMPYQPEGVWNVIRHVGRWELSKGEDRYRRGLYTFWRRVSPYPSMELFDSPSRELCTSRRIRTNTPLQALVTLNDPVYVEAARALAEKMQAEGGDSIGEKIRYGYQLLLFKNLDDRRYRKIMAFYEKTLPIYQQDHEKITQLVADSSYQNPEMATLINVASLLLNLDEVIMKG